MKTHISLSHESVDYNQAPRPWNFIDWLQPYLKRFGNQFGFKANHYWYLHLPTKKRSLTITIILGNRSSYALLRCTKLLTRVNYLKLRDKGTPLYIRYISNWYIKLLVQNPAILCQMGKSPLLGLGRRKFWFLQPPLPPPLFNTCIDDLNYDLNSHILFCAQLMLWWSTTCYAVELVLTSPTVNT